jgi:hypothetical protein
MSFSTSFCLTNIGNLLPNTTLTFYSNADGYTLPIISGVPVLSVTPPNCPYTLNGVYDGTTTIKVESLSGNCCAVINITPNDPCTFCNLGFDAFSSTTIGQIVAGNLTGNCDANITDYVIDWYDVTNSISPVFKFTSGYGTQFLPYTSTHPLTNTTAVPMLPGIYKPFLRKVRLNGVNYSYTGGTGTVQADLDCFDTITVNVSPLTCTNGDETGDYSHLIQFSGASVGTQPIPVSTAFQLSPSTNFMAWRFIGYDVADTIKMTYYGSHYNNTPIILEYYQVGNEISETNFSNNQNPKLVKSYWNGAYVKVTNLTNIVRSTNDYIVIDIIPNITNSKTNFSLQLQCLDEFDCSVCWDSFANSVTQISGITSSVDACGRLTVSFKMLDCVWSSLTTSDQYKYMDTRSIAGPRFQLAEGAPNVNGTSMSYDVYFEYSYCNSSTSYQETFCSSSNDNTITFNKDNSGVGGIGNIYMTFSNITDFNAYYNSYLTKMQQKWNPAKLPTEVAYYVGLQMKVPKLNPVSGLTETCGDTTPPTFYFIHPTSVVTTGTTGGLFTLNITMPTITNQLTWTTCQVGCTSSTNDVVNVINNSSTGTTNNMLNTNIKGNRYVTPFNGEKELTYYNNPKTRSNFNKRTNAGSFVRKTLPMSGSSFTLIPSLSAETCNYANQSDYYPNNISYGLNDDVYVQIMYNFNVYATNPLNIGDYKITASPIVNGSYAGNSQYNIQQVGTNDITIYEVQNGVVIYSDPNYVV